MATNYCGLDYRLGRTSPKKIFLADLSRLPYSTRKTFLKRMKPFSK